MLNKCYNTITGTNPYSWTLTDPRGVRRAGMLNIPARGHADLDQNTKQ